MASFGSILTGQDDSEGTGLKNIVTSAADSPYYKAAFADPESRAALLQIGLNLMQPRELGQSAFGQIGQAIGAGGESVDRAEEADRKERDSDTKQQRADDALTIAELRLKNARNPNELTPYQQQSLQLQQRSQNRNDAKETRAERVARQKDIKAGVDAAVEARDSLVLPDTHPEKARWAGKTNDQIQSEIENQYNTKVGKIPDDDADTGGGGVAAAVPPPASRVTGQVYQTPQGPLKWVKSGSGFGWVRP